MKEYRINPSCEDRVKYLYLYFTYRYCIRTAVVGVWIGEDRFDPFCEDGVKIIYIWRYCCSTSLRRRRRGQVRALL